MSPIEKKMLEGVLQITKKKSTPDQKAGEGIPSILISRMVDYLYSSDNGILLFFIQAEDGLPRKKLFEVHCGTEPVEHSDRQYLVFFEATLAGIFLGQSELFFPHAANRKEKPLLQPRFEGRDIDRAELERITQGRFVLKAGGIYNFQILRKDSILN